MDILETVNAATSAHGTIHHGSNWPNNTSHGGSIAGNWSQDFHTYAMEWEPDEIRWYVNGTRYYRVTSATWFSTAAPNNPRAPFDTPFHLLLNVAVGGNWPGNPTDATPFPAQLQVDYVRVSQRPPQGPFGAMPLLPARIEAERFDVGGGSIAYNDVDPENRGNQLRTQEAVDIENCSEGGHNVGFFSSGEWMEYTVQVPRAGQYEIRLRYATQTAGCSVGVSIDGVAAGANTNGIYDITMTINGVATPTPVYCLMDSAMDGGGWTLVMKAAQGSTAFNYFANYWTTANTLNPTDISVASGDAKYSTFNHLSATSLLAVFPDINTSSFGSTERAAWRAILRRRVLSATSVNLASSPATSLS
jgi:hypothetical protein